MSGYNIEEIQDEVMGQIVHIFSPYPHRVIKKEVVNKVIKYVTEHRLSITKGSGGKWPEIYVYGFKEEEVQEHKENIRVLVES